MRIAVDFDGTLCRGLSKKSPYSQSIFHKMVLVYVKKKQKQGVVVILNTCRTNPDSIARAGSFLSRKGFLPDYINSNDPLVIREYKKDSRKIDADIHIDDKNIGLIGWLLRTF